MGVLATGVLLFGVYMKAPDFWKLQYAKQLPCRPSVSASGRCCTYSRALWVQVGLFTKARLPRASHMREEARTEATIPAAVAVKGRKANQRREETDDSSMR